MTQPTVENFSIVRGDDWSTVLRFSQALSGFDEIEFTIRDTWASSETDNTGAVFAGSLTGGEIVADGTYDVTVSIPNATTLGMTGDEYRYDIQVTTVSDKIYTTQRGCIRMIPDVTR